MDQAEEAAKLLDDGVIIIDKPPGQTSHEITTAVKKIVGAKRSGHAGTLDPDVSGVLPIALGRATKLLQYIAGKEKTYVGIVKFRVPKSRVQVEALFKEFTGALTQTPPKISAVKKAPRKRTVYSLELLELEATNRRLALFETRVDAGTYIRTLCEDMGKKEGVGGARMEELRRTQVGRISEKNAFTMQELIDAMWFYREKKDPSLLLRMVKKPDMYIEMPKVQIKETALASIASGAQIMAPAVENADKGILKGDRVMIYCEDLFVGIGIANESTQVMRRLHYGIVVRLERMHLSKEDPEVKKAIEESEKARESAAEGEHEEGRENRGNAEGEGDESANEEDAEYTIDEDEARKEARESEGKEMKGKKTERRRK